MNEAKRIALAVVALSACGWGIWASEREGFSRMLSTGVKRDAAQLTSADQAIRLSPSDPKGYAARAYALSNTKRFAEAVKDYETAVALRPGDYLLWLRLGHARDWSENQAGALAAYGEAVRLAPFYAQPHWYLGKLLLRLGRKDEAFAELRRAATSNPQLFPNLIARVWEALDGDVQAVVHETQPQTPAARLALARFFAEHGRALEAIELFRGTSGSSDEDRRALLAALIAAKRFSEAFEVWTAGHQQHRGQPGVLIDGSFEQEINLNDPGFGWQLTSKLPSVRTFLDPTNPHHGSYSLRLDWSGESDPSIPVISQLVLVAPKTRYRLSFAARPQELLTIGLPLVAVSDARDDDKTRVLMKSKALPPGTSGWQDYMVEFTTAETTSAVTISIRRVTCDTAECAVFGHVWFDNFSLERL